MRTELCKYRRWVAVSLLLRKSPEKFVYSLVSCERMKLGEACKLNQTPKKRKDEEEGRERIFKEDLEERLEVYWGRVHIIKKPNNT